jgi:hypothetical protein
MNPVTNARQQLIFSLTAYKSVRMAMNKEYAKFHQISCNTKTYGGRTNCGSRPRESEKMKVTLALKVASPERRLKRPEGEFLEVNSVRAFRTGPAG